MKLGNLLVVAVLLLLTQLSFGNDDIYVGDLGDKIKYYDATGEGNAGDSDIPAIRKHEAYVEAKKDALEEGAEFLEGIKDKKDAPLREVAVENTMLVVVFEETLDNVKVIDRQWDENDNATVKIRIDLKEFKNRLEEIGVE